MTDFMLGGHRIGLDRRDSTDEFRILVDGAAIPMVLTESETYEGNTGSRTRELTVRRPVSWAPARERVGKDGLAAEAERSGTSTIRFRFTLPSGEIYNTVVWQSMTLTLTFAHDPERVEVLWEHYIDTST